MTYRLYLPGSDQPIRVPREAVRRMQRRRESGVMQALFWGAWRWCVRT